MKRSNDALEMARLYAILHAFENEVRSLIRDTLEEASGPDWLGGLLAFPAKHISEKNSGVSTKDL